MAIDPKSTYYDVGGIEAIDYIKAKLKGATLDPFVAGCLFNILRYASRLPYKGQALRDAEKISVYATLLNAELEPKEPADNPPEIHDAVWNPEPQTTNELENIEREVTVPVFIGGGMESNTRNKMILNTILTEGISEAERRFNIKGDWSADGWTWHDKTIRDLQEEQISE